jgi:tRNA A37 threonylcarbamoyladenosine synthetase subunit TsaC/SUA5/YrdC
MSGPEILGLSYDVIVSAHCHNQLGLALPNTLAAISAGARQVETCLLGIGDAGGNLALEQFLACKEHFFDQNCQRNSDEYVTAFATQSETSLSDTVNLCKESSRMFQFNIGENQPIIGSRAFTCTTGIHQDNMGHMSHTAFNPNLAGRKWAISINRHSSRKALLSALLRCGADEKDISNENLIDGIYAWVKDQLGERSDISLLNHYNQYVTAYHTIASGHTAIIPTTVGYTLATNHLGVDNIKQVKGLPDGKPFGILGTKEIYEKVFGVRPPSNLSDKVCMGFLGPVSVSGNANDDLSFLTRECFGNDNNVGIWLNLGPVHKYIATRLWKERREIIIASSCNKAGEGNPSADFFSTSFLDSDVRSRAEFEVDIPHWGTPQFSEEGRWLSATILNQDTGKIVRVGRDINIAVDCINEIQNNIEHASMK